LFDRPFALRAPRDPTVGHITAAYIVRGRVKCDDFFQNRCNSIFSTEFSVKSYVGKQKLNLSRFDRFKKNSPLYDGVDARFIGVKIVRLVKRAVNRRN